MSPRGLVLIGILMELCYLTFYFCAEGPGEVLLFIVVNWTTFLLLSFLIWRKRNNRAVTETGRGTALAIITFGVLFRLTLLPHPVVGSDDIYRYLWDGRVAAAGINPLSYLPTDPHLSHLATADLPAKVNHPEMRTLYPALAEAFFLIAHKLFGESVAGLKLLLVCMDFLTIVFLWRLLRQRGDSMLPLLLYSWSPLPVMYFGLDGHIDALAIPFLILFLMYCAANKPFRAVCALGLSVLAKLIPLLVVPLLLRFHKGIRRFSLPAIPVLMAAIGYLVYSDLTWEFVDPLKMFGSRWEFNGGFFSIPYFLTGSNSTAHGISGAAIVIYLGALALIKRPLTEKVFWSFAGFILLSPVVHPWYLTWLAALLVVRWSLAVFVFLGLSNIANIVVYQYRAFGQWNDQPILLLLEYVPVAILLAREIVRKEFLRSTGIVSPFSKEIAASTPVDQ